METRLEHEASSALRSAPDEDRTATDGCAVGGARPLAEILQQAPRATGRRVIEGIATHDPMLAEEVRGYIFLFEDVLTLDDATVQQLVRHLVTTDLALVLKGADDRVLEKFLRNMSRRTRDALLEEIEVLGPVLVSASRRDSPTGGAHAPFPRSGGHRRPAP